MTPEQSREVERRPRVRVTPASLARIREQHRHEELEEVRPLRSGKELPTINGNTSLQPGQGVLCNSMLRYMRSHDMSIYEIRGLIQCLDLVPDNVLQLVGQDLATEPQVEPPSLQQLAHRCLAAMNIATELDKFMQRKGRRGGRSKQVK